MLIMAHSFGGVCEELIAEINRTSQEADEYMQRKAQELADIDPLNDPAGWAAHSANSKAEREKYVLKVTALEERHRQNGCPGAVKNTLRECIDLWQPKIDALEKEMQQEVASNPAERTVAICAKYRPRLEALAKSLVECHTGVQLGGSPEMNPDITRPLALFEVLTAELKEIDRQTDALLKAMWERGQALRQINWRPGAGLGLYTLVVDVWSQGKQTRFKDPIHVGYYANSAEAFRAATAIMNSAHANTLPGYHWSGTLLAYGARATVGGGADNGSFVVGSTSGPDALPYPGATRAPLAGGGRTLPPSPTSPKSTVGGNGVFSVMFGL
jgi:hypothetical protein